MNVLVIIDFQGRISAQSLAGDVLLQLGVDPEDGDENGERGPEGEVGGHGVVGLGQVDDPVTVLLHGLNVLGVSPGFIALGQYSSNGVPKLRLRCALYLSHTLTIKFMKVD